MQFALLAKRILILKGFPELIQVMKFAVSEMEFALQKREKKFNLHVSLKLLRHKMEHGMREKSFILI